MLYELLCRYGANRLRRRQQWRMRGTWMDAKKLAGEFRRQIQAQRDLLGLALSSRYWVRPNYPLFCQSLGIDLAANTLQGFRKGARRPHAAEAQGGVASR